MASSPTATVTPAALPPGFTLDSLRPQPPQPQPEPQSGTLPPGFELDESQPGLASRAWEAANAPLVSRGILEKTPAGAIGNALRSYANYKLPQEIASGNPLRAGLAQFVSGTIGDVEDFERSLSSPVNLALLATGTPEAKTVLGSIPGLAKSVTAARTLLLGYFAGRGTQEALTGQLPNESEADAYERRLFGVATAFAVGAHAAVQTGQFIKDSLSRTFGLNDDLSGRVAERVQKINSARALSDEYDERDRLAQQADKQSLEDVRQSIQERGAILQKDFADAVHAEHVRLGAIFDQIEEKAGDTPVVRTDTIYKSLLEGIEQRGIPHDIAHETAQGILTKYAGGPKELNWAETKAVRNGLWREALKSSTSRPVAAAMTDTIDKILGSQEYIAEKLGVGDIHDEARRDYSQLMRDTIRSGIGRRLLARATVDDEINARRLAAFTSTPANVEIVKRLFNAFGVDTKPLDNLHADQERLQTAIKERRNLVSPEDRQAVKAALRSAIRPEPGNRAVVPGVDYEELASKSAEELRRLRVEKLMQAARARGMTRPGPYIMLGYGLIRLLMGSPFGVFMAGYGGARLGADELIRNERYAAWLASESGTGDVAKMTTALKAIIGMSGNQARNRDSGERFQ